LHPLRAGLQSDVLAYGSMYMLAGGMWRLADAISRLSDRRAGLQFSLAGV